MVIINFMREVLGSVSGGNADSTSDNQPPSRGGIVLHAIGAISMRVCSQAGGQLIFQYPEWSESLHQAVTSEADFIFGERDRARALRLVTRIEQADPAYFPI